MPEPILTNLSEGIYRVMLNNPDKYNCMGRAMLRRLEEAVGTAQTDDTIRVVLFAGVGERAFSTGANLKEFATLKGSAIDDWIRTGHRIFNAIEDLPKPTVAQLDGYVMGGGLELALACDFRLGTSRTVLASPEVKNGWLPGWGGMARLRRLFGEAVAKRVVLLADHIDASEALRLGLLTKQLSDERAEEELSAFLEHLRSLNASAYGLAKHALQQPTTTRGHSVDFDILATHQAKSG